MGERAGEADDRERTDDREQGERAPWPARARERLAALVPTEASEESEPTPTPSTVDPGATEGSASEGDRAVSGDRSEADDADEEENEAPIPADD